MLFPHRFTEGNTNLDIGTWKCYLGINHHGVPVINDLLVIAEERSWELTQKEYINNITVIKSIADNRNIDVSNLQTVNDERVQMVIDQIKSIPRLDYKFRTYCEVREKFKDDQSFTEKLLVYYTKSEFENLYSHFGYNKCRSVSFQLSDLRKIIHDETNADPLKKKILSTFKVGDKYLLSEAKETLRTIYQEVGLLNKNPKASDLEDYFNTKMIRKINNSTGKWSKAYQLISIK
jgi:hypothetical protein